MAKVPAELGVFQPSLVFSSFRCFKGLRNGNTNHIRQMLRVLNVYSMNGLTSLAHKQAEQSYCFKGEVFQRKLTYWRKCS